MKYGQQGETPDWYSDTPERLQRCAGSCVGGVCEKKKPKLTGNSEDVSLDLSGDVHATSPLGVVCPTQAGHVGHAALMDVHHTVWRQTEREKE